MAETRMRCTICDILGGVYTQDNASISLGSNRISLRIYSEGTITSVTYMLRNIIWFKTEPIETRLVIEEVK